MAESDTGLLPNWLRWILRFASYVSFMLLIGVVATSFFVWPAAIKLTAIRRIAFASLASVAVLAFAQLAVLAHDIDPANWKGALTRTQSFDIGKALLARIGGAILGFAVLLSKESKSRPGQKVLVGGICGFLAATWAASGHSLSQRWSVVGVPLDTVHHLAAAGWLGSLVIAAAFAFRHAAKANLANVFQRLSRFAFTSVVLIVFTGVVQSYRLIGGLSGSAFRVGHTQLLLVKLVGVTVMLAIANTHRKRVQKLSEATPPDKLADLFRRSLITEFVIGVAVLAITASMVVNSPAIVETDRSAAKTNHPIPLSTN